MIVIDTNVLVYAANDAAVEQAACRRWLESMRAGVRPFHLTWGIAYEFLRVVTHPRFFGGGVQLAQGLGFLRAVTSAPGCSMLIEGQRHGGVLDVLADDQPTLRGSILHDGHTVVLMREHGVRRILTRDTNLARFTDIDVIDPMVANPPG